MGYSEKEKEGSWVLQEMSASLYDLYKFWFVEQRTPWLIDFNLTLFLVGLCYRTMGFIMTLPSTQIDPSSYSAHLPSCLLPASLWSSFPKQLPSVSIVFKLHSLAGSMRFWTENKTKQNRNACSLGGN